MSEQTSEVTQTGTLLAGAGRATIQMPAGLFPKEGFRGVHDMLQARVLLLESRGRMALVSIELTSLPDDEVVALQELVGEAAGLPSKNVWICVTHTFSAPHITPQHLSLNADEREKDRLLSEAVRAAAREAASLAVLGMKRARLGCETGCCDVNVNRDILTEDGWWLGCNETGPSDKSVTVLRLEDLAGDPIALVFGYGVQSSVMDEPPTAGGARQVSADLAGAASRFVEREYDGAMTAMFCMGAAGDQAPALKGARSAYVGRDGRMRVKDVDEQGFVIAEMLGARLGAEVVRVSEQTDCRTFADSLVMQQSSVRCPGQEMTVDTHSLRPARQHDFVSGPERDVPLGVITLGDVALIGVGPELSCQTAMSIKERSPFRETMVLTMVNGGAKYMADLSGYDRITYEAMNSPFARGSAELLCEKVVGLLHVVRK